jgi:dienelactone hydrolase
MQPSRTSAAVLLLVGVCEYVQTREAEAQQPPAAQPTSRPAASAPALTCETVTLSGGDPATIQIAYCTNTVKRHPAILMLGSLKRDELPPWSTDLVREGYMLVAFSVAHPPDPDPARRSQWLFFDERFAHSYVLGGYNAPRDARRVIDYLVGRGDVDRDKIGWLGSSSTGIPALAVATQGPRLAAIVAFVSTGAYRQWFETWHTNGLWRGKTNGLWPETEALLKYDPILHVDKMFPTAVLMVSGGHDKVVDPKTARAFMDAARPYYESDPNRLRLVIYEGFGHNLPADVVKMYAEHWFHLYMHPTQPPPPVPEKPRTLRESAKQTQINAAEHKDVAGAK